MSDIRCLVKGFILDEDGPTAVEYAIMLALVLVVTISAISNLGGTTDGLFKKTFDAAYGS